MYEPTACVPIFANATNNKELNAKAGKDKAINITAGSVTISPVKYCIAIAITAPITTNKEPDIPCPNTPAQYPPLSVLVILGIHAIPPISVITKAKLASIERIYGITLFSNSIEFGS